METRFFRERGGGLGQFRLRCPLVCVATHISVFTLDWRELALAVRLG